jgi:uncharacterized protein YfaS (alpha-2-macroglobulin family)
MANNYNVGDVVRVAVEFRDAASGNLVNPAQVRLKIRTPSGVITTVTHPNVAIVTDGTGLFRTDILLAEPREYRVRWEGKNTNRAAEEVSIIAEISQFYSLAGAEKLDS